jgi:hypothetical protein
MVKRALIAGIAGQGGACPTEFLPDENRAARLRAVDCREASDAV